MPRAKNALPPRNGRLAKRRPTPPPLSTGKFRPLKVDIPDATLPRRHTDRRQTALHKELEVEKLERSSAESPRPYLEFPPRLGQSVYCGARTPRFYLESVRNLAYRLLKRSKNDGRNEYVKKRRGFLSTLAQDWMRKRKKRRWIEPRRDNRDDVQLFHSVFGLIDQRFRGGRLFYREESINTYVYYRVKFEHFFRGTIVVLERDLYMAAKEMQYELEFEDASRRDEQFVELFGLIGMRYANARVMHKKDKYGRRHVKVEHDVCGFRACGRTSKDAIDYLCNLYYYDIGVRKDRRMKHWRDIFDAIELYYPDSKLFFKQISHGWYAKVVHEVEGKIASGRGWTLDIALEQVRNKLEDVIERLQETRGRVGRWKC